MCMLGRYILSEGVRNHVARTTESRITCPFLRNGARVRVCVLGEGMRGGVGQKWDRGVKR